VGVLHVCSAEAVTVYGSKDAGGKKIQAQNGEHLF